MNISEGRIESAKKVVIYGPEGIGKSTFAAQFPGALFSDTEGSTKALDVRRFDKPTSWEMLRQQAAYVKEHKPCKTYIVDTIDWAEQMCLEHICSINDKKGIEDFGYGNGYVYEKEDFGRYLNSLDEIIDVGINVVLTAHAQLRKFEQPDELGAYDRWELKLGKKTASQISPLVKEWADMVLFANYKTFAVQVDKDGKKFKAQGGARVMYTQHHSCWDAKNRYDLAEELPFDFREIAHIFNTVTPPTKKKAPKTTPVPDDVPPIPEEAPPIPEEPQQEPLPNYIPKALQDLMSANAVTEEDIRLAVSYKGYFPYETSIENYGDSFINGCLIGAWPQVYEIIKNNKENHPFAGNN